MLCEGACWLHWRIAAACGISSVPRGRSHPFHVADLIRSTWQDSSSDLVRDLFPTDAPPSPTKTSRRPRGAKSVDKMTVGSQFMTQLASLMRTINSTDVHYIRYISARLPLLVRCRAERTTRTFLIWQVHQAESRVVATCLRHETFGPPAALRGRARGGAP